LSVTCNTSSTAVIEEMNCQEEGDRLSLCTSSGYEDGDGDSDGFSRAEQGSSMPLPESTRCYSNDISAMAMAKAEITSHTDHTDVTSITCSQFLRSLRHRRDRWNKHHSRSNRKTFLLVAIAVIFAIASIVATMRNNDHTNIFRNNSELQSLSSSSRQQIWSQQRTRFLEEEDDDDDDDDGIVDIDDVFSNSSETNDEDIDPTDESVVKNASNQTEATEAPGNNEDSLETIEVLLPPGVSLEDEDAAVVIGSLIQNATSTPSLTPVTDSPSSTFNPLSRLPTPSPSISFQPSPGPTVSPQPTMTMSPTMSPEPSSSPSSIPSNEPTLEPTISPAPSFLPSASPSDSLEPSEHPSSAPTESPSISAFPSLYPTISFEPTTSAYPSMPPSAIPSSVPSAAPTPVATTIKMKANNLMILTNVPDMLNNTTIPHWETVTSQHVIDFFETFSATFTNDFAFEIVSIETEFISQTPLEVVETKVTETPTSRQDHEPPPLDPIDIPGTLKLQIIYDQRVTYETDAHNLTEEELLDRLFVLPFTTDSLHYSMDLYNELNWTTWVMVDTVIPTPSPPPPPVQQPASRAERLTASQTFAISASTIIAACLIVLFLLWERNQKGDIHFGMNSPREGGFSVDSRMHALQGIPIEENGFHFYDRSESATEETGYASASIRSAPGHLRRNSIERGIVHRRDSFLEERRGRLGSKGDISISSKGKFGTTRSVYSKASSNSSNAENPTEMSPKQQSPVVSERYGSPGIPQQVPVSIRGTSAPFNRNKSDKGDKNDRPFLPPLPPPASFGSSAMTPERPRTESPGVMMPLKDSSGNNQSAAFSRPSSAFRRPSSRAFGMRLSGVGNDDMTEISILTDPFSSDNRRYSGDFVIPNPQFNDPNFGSGRSRSENFLSPLHIPDEENMNRAPIDPLLSPTPESPIQTMSTMLGLESRPIDDALTPARAAFAMTVKDIEDDLEI